MAASQIKPADISEPGDLDRLLHAAQARFTGSLSPASLILAFMDWSLHLANAPARRLELTKLAAYQWIRLMQPEHWIAPQLQDHRFTAPDWAKPPFNAIAQAFLLGEDWWRTATAQQRGVTRHHSNIVAFQMRQILDMVAPSNFAWTNPEVMRVTETRNGANFADGWRNYLEDLRHLARGETLDGDDRFKVGETLAVTPGKVVLRNELMELIQYAPTTGTVHPEPLLIVPAWIMKYYILDLSPGNSLVRYLVSQGFTVFCISWRNPGKALAGEPFDAYRKLGVMAALDAIQAITGSKRIHALGYCLGGTLLSIAAAAMARDGDTRLATVGLLAAQTDFSEAGELQLFTDESQLAMLDDVMWQQGYLDSSQMAGAFQMLRSNDLIWSRLIRTYLMGEREALFDLMAWNADATRMPARMHSEYLHHMFLHNDLAEGRYMVEDKPVTISEITAPIFAVSTETDHVAPWRSVYKINLLANRCDDITYVLTSGGHNAGIVSEPGHPHRHFRIARRVAGGIFLAPDDWMATNPPVDGSWWPRYADWLAARSGAPVGPPPLGVPAYPPLGDAPGTYVREP